MKLHSVIYIIQRAALCVDWKDKNPYYLAPLYVKPRHRGLSISKRKEDLEMYFKGDIVITDPMYIIKNEEDWHRCEYGEKLEALDIFTYITAGNGDEFGSDIVPLDTHESLGEFCSDSCMVSVMLLSEVRQYNPDFDKDLGEYCYTIIRNFDGDVQLVEMEECDDNGQRLYFIGKGNKNFRTDFFE